MTERRRGFALVFAMMLLLSPWTGAAQSPWTVKVVSTMNPLPIGACGAVRLSVLDATGKSQPRGPNGALITMADFDMSVASDEPRTVIGRQIDEYHYSVCACQAAKVGSAATITATYPAKALAERSRAPDVRIESSAPLTVKARMGDAEPPGCEKQRADVSAAETRPVPTGASRGGALTPVQTAPVPDVPIPTIAKPGSEMPLETAPLPAGTRPARALRAAGPGGVTASGAGPLIANITWSEVPTAVRYAVWRGSTGTVAVERTPPNYTAKQFRDTLPDPRPVYQYTVIAHYADGTSGSATAVPFTSPALRNPAELTIRDRTKGNVDFAWSPVVGAVRYRLDGPGIPGTGFYTKDTSTQYPNIPAGPGTWKVTALYSGNFADYATATTAAAVIRVLPTHSQTWLTKSNGAGSLAQVQMPFNPFDPEHPCSPYNKLCQSGETPVNQNVSPGDVAPFGYNPATLFWLDQVPSDNWSRTGLKRWLDVNLTLWNETNYHGESEVVYGNPLDLGVGRRANCAQEMKGPPHAGLKTVCYASAYGVAPGHAGFDTPANYVPGLALKEYLASPGVHSSFEVPVLPNTAYLLTMMIVKDPSGTSFMVFTNGSKQYNLSPTVTLDTEGPKLVPFACLSCHGGTFNPTTRKVDNASLLPLDPGMLAFADPAGQAAAEEKLRQLNLMIRNAQPQSAVASYLNGLYNGGIQTAGTKAQPDYIPASWAAQSGFYRSVVKPHCAMCHLAAQPSWNFASWQNFDDNKALIHADVCGAHTMPHAEIPFKSFWTKDTGALYLPGVLAATLGFQSC